MRELVEGALPQLDLGPTPELRWVKPTTLSVDDTYQRNLTRKSRKLISKLILNFSWSKMKPPIVVDTNGILHCIDGQHTAIAAATLQIPQIPIFVVSAQSQKERAGAFVAHNRDRLVLSPLDLYRAKQAQGDKDALDTAEACRRAGVHIKIINQTTARIDVGDTMAVATVQRLVKRQGLDKAVAVLEALVKGGRAPISASEIDAVEAAMCMIRPQTTVPEMSRVIQVISDHGVIEAKMEAAIESKPHKHMLFEKYMKILEKQTGVSRALAAS
jgi:hypothetical protein